MQSFASLHSKEWLLLSTVIRLSRVVSSYFLYHILDLYSGRFGELWAATDLLRFLFHSVCAQDTAQVLQEPTAHAQLHSDGKDMMFSTLMLQASPKVTTGGDKHCMNFHFRYYLECDYATEFLNEQPT